MEQHMRKAYNRARRLIAKAKCERNLTGYREELGYDQCRVLQDYCNQIGLSYSETSHVLAHFEEACDNL